MANELFEMTARTLILESSDGTLRHVFISHPDGSLKVQTQSVNSLAAPETILRENHNGLNNMVARALEEGWRIVLD